MCCAHPKYCALNTSYVDFAQGGRHILEFVKKHLVEQTNILQGEFDSQNLLHWFLLSVQELDKLLILDSILQFSWQCCLFCKTFNPHYRIRLEAWPTEEFLPLQQCSSVLRSEGVTPTFGVKELVRRAGKCQGEFDWLPFKPWSGAVAAAILTYSLSIMYFSHLVT